MNPFNFIGVAVAAVTPFDEAGEIDLALLGDLISWWIDEGIEGIVLCGSTGEMAYLSAAERGRLFEFGVAACAGRVPVIAGTGFPSTDETINTTRAAAEAGVDAALVVTPYYYPLNEAALVAHYEAVAAEAGVPVLLYNMPPLTKVNLTPKLVGRLSRIPGIAGIKDSAGDLTQLQQILANTGENFCVLTGSFPQLGPAVAAGARGGILAMANLIPATCAALRRRAAAGDAAGAAKLYEEFESLQDWVKAHGIPGIKFKLNEWHHPAGRPRPPLQPLVPA